MKIAFAAAAALLVTAASHAQPIRAMDFRNQAITDILLVLAEASGTSIIPDGTVSGTASFHFSDSDLMDALEVFLGTYRLYQRREGSVIRVSRIDASWDAGRGLLSLRAENVPVEELVKAAGRAAGHTALYDALPATPISLDVRDLPLRRVLEIMLVMLPDFSLEEGEGYYHIRKTAPAPRAGSGGAGVPDGREEWITREGDLFSAHVERGRFLEILGELFRKGGREYSILSRTDAALENLYFSGRDFDSLLRLILEQGNADYVRHGGVYYVVELQRRDILKKLRETRVVSLRHIQAQDFPSLIPTDLAGGNIVKVDKNTNSIILTGTAEEINPVAEFAALVDRPQEWVPPRRFDLSFIGAAELLSLLPPRFSSLAPAAAPGGHSVIAQGPEEGLAALGEFIARVDQRNEGRPVRLRFIRIEDLLKNLPPSASAEDIRDSGYPNLIFFTGPEERRTVFLRELEMIDRPRPQIRYELLVVEYLKSRETGRNGGVQASSRPGAGQQGNTPSDGAGGAGKPDPGQSGFSFLGSLSNILNLNFDVVSQFGHQFALNLSAMIGENTAQVYADTTMNGLSGQEIRFQNTDTYRYQELEADPDTGALRRSGITREISSGIIVSLSGWVSGDDMITITVNATVSKQHRSPGGDGSGIPSTSERIVTTQIRTPSGIPIVLSGLIKEDDSRAGRKIPLLGDIPVLGNLFGEDSRTRERTEIVIYIVPYLQRDGEEAGDVPGRIENYYRRFFAGGFR